MGPGKRRQLPATTEGRLQEFCGKARTHILAKVEHPFRILKQKLGFSKARLRGLKKNCFTPLGLGSIQSLERFFFSPRKRILLSC